MSIDVFFDIDGSLIDTHYQYNLEKKIFKESILLAQSLGARFHLNSNRSVKSMLGIREDLGFNGLIIYENGIGVYDPTVGKKLVTDCATINKKELSNYLNELGYSCSFIDTDILSKDFVWSDYAENNVHVFGEKSREYTMTLYPRRNIAGKISFDNLTPLKVALENKYPLYLISENMLYHNIIMVPKTAHKGGLLRTLGQDTVVISFGDEIADISMFDNSQYCGCPANALDIVKQTVSKKGGFVADECYTAGAYSFLQNVLGRYLR